MRTGAMSVVFLLASCTASGPAAEVDEHQERWDAHGFVLYKMTLTFNTPTRDEQTLDVLVRDGKDVDRAYLNMKKVRVREDGTVDGIPATVSGLFDVVRDSGDADTVAGGVARHALQGDGEQIREFSTRTLEAVGRRVGDVVRRDAEVGLGGVQAAEGNSEWHVG